MNDDNDFLRNCFALTGSIGTGKSTAASMLENLGAHIIDTDLIAREVVEPGQPALEEIRDTFGEKVIHEDGTLNREVLRDEIIRNPDSRNTLNLITHPRINAIVMDRIKYFNSLNDGMPVIIDVPLLFESGWDRFFPRVILVYVPVEIQLERLMSRDTLDMKTAELTVGAQISIDEKKAKASYIIDNSRSTDETRRQVEDVFKMLRQECSTS